MLHLTISIIIYNFLKLGFSIIVQFLNVILTFSDQSGIEWKRQMGKNPSQKTTPNIVFRIMNKLVNTDWITVTMVILYTGLPTLVNPITKLKKMPPNIWIRNLKKSKTWCSLSLVSETPPNVAQKLHQCVSEWCWKVYKPSRLVRIGD